MKAIFTYPNNSGTSFIDPNYIGDDTVGFQKRIKELVDGSYKQWAAPIPSDTVSNIMSELSKYNEATWFETSGNNSIFNFWENPLYTGITELISENISSATATHTVTSNVEFASNHGLYDSQLMTLSGFDGSWSALNGNDYYVKKIDADTIQLCTDSALTLPIEFYDVENATLSSALIPGGDVDFNINTTLHNDLTSNQLVVLSGLDGTMAEHNGSNFYVQNLTANDFNLSYDSAGNTMLGYPASANNQPMISITIPDSGAVVVQLPSPSGDDLPFGSQVDFDGNDATASGPQGQWPSGVYQGPSTMLSAAGQSGGVSGALFTKVLNASANTYEVFFDSACTNPVTKSSSLGWSPDAPDRQAGSCTVDTPITLARIGDSYTFRMQYSNTGSLDLSGNSLYQIITKDYYQFEGFPGAGSSSGFSGYSKRDTGDFYFPYSDSALTNPANLGFHILNAYKVLYTIGDNTKLFLQQKLDDQGNILTNKDVILDEDTLVSLINNGGGNTRDNVLAILDASLQYYTFSDQQATGGVNPYGFLNPDDASITGQTRGGAEQTLDGNAIMTISSSSSSYLDKTWDVSGYTEHVTQIAPSDPSDVSYANLGGAMVVTAPYNKTTNTSSWSSASGSFFTNLENMYNQNPDTVIGRPFVFGWDYDVSTGSDSGTPSPGTFIYGGQPNNTTSPKQAYMLPLGYKTYTDGNGDTQAQFMFQVYDIDTTTAYYGDIGTNKGGFRGNNSGAPRSIFGATNIFADDKVLRTYLNNTFTTSRTPLTSEISITPTSWTDTSNQSVTGSMLTGVTSKLRTGDLITVKKQEISTGTITIIGEYIANMAATYTTPDAGGNFTGTVWLLPTDGTNGWGNYTGNSAGLDVNLPSSTTHTIFIETRYETLLSNTGTIPGGFYIPTTVDNYAYMNVPLVTALYTEGELWSNQIGTNLTEVTTYDIGYSYQDSTQGEVQEVYTPATPNIIPTGQDIDATTGTLTVEANENHRYKLSSVSDHMYGNKTYLQRTGASTYVNNARLKTTSAWGAGETYQATIGHFPVTTVGTNVAGYPDGVFTMDTEFPGAFASSGGVAFELETVPDTYTPPAISPAASEDVFDTDDEWADYGYANGQKNWPSHVTPSKADIVYNAPTIANMSQSGIKYTRSVGHTDWRLDVAYPPMTHEEFQKFHAIAQAAQGQAMPFNFKLKDKNGGSILWKKFEDTSVSTNSPRFKNAVANGDRLALIEGFQSNESNAFLQGEVFIDGNNDNGYVHTVLNQVDANVYGEAKIRTPWPFRAPVVTGDFLYKEPSSIVVTLANDNFEYKVDTSGYYYMSVSFDLDDWK